MITFIDHYIKHIKDLGGSPLAAVFDEDIAPEGPGVRAMLEEGGHITQSKGRIYLADKYKGEPEV